MVSTKGALILASMILADLFAFERKRTRRRLEESDHVTTAAGVRAQEREITINAWQARWDRVTTARWTHTMIPSVKRWFERPDNSSTFRLTQLLSGHGCFRSYLHRMNRAPDSICVYCGNEDDPAEHNIFVCSH
jgi:hypothetical protein